MTDKIKLEVPKVTDYFSTVSAFHKCLRRSDIPQAIYWGLSLGVPRAFKYMYGIVTEETRSLYLLNRMEEGKKMGKELSVNDFAYYVALFCNATKRWEVPYAHDFAMLQHWVAKDKRDGKLEFSHSLDDIPTIWQPDFENMGQWVHARLLMDTVEVLLDQFGWEGANFRALYRQSDSPPMQAIFKYGQGYHSNLFAIQVLTRLWTEEMDRQLNQDSDELEAQVQQQLADAKQLLMDGPGYDIPDYAYDKHTRKGKAKYTKMMRDGSFTHDTVPAVDMRYSGTSMSTWWRSIAIRNCGSILVPWPDAIKTHDEQLEFYELRDNPL